MLPRLLPVHGSSVQSSLATTSAICQWYMPCRGSSLFHSPINSSLGAFLLMYSMILVVSSSGSNAHYTVYILYECFSFSLFIFWSKPFCVQNTSSCIAILSLIVQPSLSNNIQKKNIFLISFLKYNNCFTINTIFIFLNPFISNKLNTTKDLELPRSQNKQPYKTSQTMPTLQVIKRSGFHRKNAALLLHHVAKVTKLKTV